ncbi:MAG: phosphatase PAP2 family protein [Methylophilaceae bacterium]
MTLENINIQLFKLINAQSSASELTINLAIILADYVIFLLPIYLMITWLFGNNSKKEIVLKSVCVTLISLGIAQIIVFVYPHPRPFMMGVGRTLITHASVPSFPSDHMTVFSSIAITYLMARYYAIGLTISVVGIFVAWSRVYLGVHFPFDMIGAVLVSLFVAIAIQPVWKKSGSALTGIAITTHQKVFNLPIKNGWIK